MRSCPICRSRRLQELPKRVSTQRALCRGCGCLYLPGGRAAAPGGGDHYMVREAAGATVTARAARAAAWLRGRLPAAATLLEIGSADTSVLAPLRAHLPAARLRGAHVADFAAAGGEAAACERAAHGWQVRPVRAASHDAVLLPYTLQRLPELDRALAAARDALAPGGWLYLECSNLLEPHPGKRLKSWVDSQELGCFSLAMLEVALARGGFRVERAEAGTSLQVLAAPAPPREQAVRSELTGVLRGLLWHEVRYWPPYVVRRVKQMTGART